MRRELLASFYGAIVLCGLQGCADMFGTDPITGVYDLETVNGKPLAEVSCVSPCFRPKSGSLDLRKDGTYERVANLSADPDPLRTTESGTFSQDGSIFTFLIGETKASDGSTISGSGNSHRGDLDGRNVTIVQRQDTLKYRHR